MSAFEFKDDLNCDLNNLRITNNKITLVSLNHNFVGEIFKEFNEKIALHMTPTPAKEINETKAFIDASIQGMKSQKELVMAIIDQNDEFLGCCGLHIRSESRTPEFGIWIKESAHGNKYGLNAITELQKWALNNINIDYFIYPVDRVNLASRNIPETLGGEVYKELKVKAHSGHELDEVVYKIPTNT